jgi:hypothetical protein
MSATPRCIDNTLGQEVMRLTYSSSKGATRPARAGAIDLLTITTLIATFYTDFEDALLSLESAFGTGGM